LWDNGVTEASWISARRSPFLARDWAPPPWSGSSGSVAFVLVWRRFLSVKAAYGILASNVEGLKYSDGGGEQAMTVKAGVGAPSQSSAVAREIWELLIELSMSRMRQRFLATITDLGLSLPQAHALKVLRPGNPIAMRELADGLHCDPSNITGIVDRLGDRGLVERGSAPGDRRVKTLMLTEEGTAMRMRLLDRLSEPPPGLGKLSAVEQRQLRDLLRRSLLDD
jgi:DNA-binding MarR family transcriptional regulator